MPTGSKRLRQALLAATATMTALALPSTGGAPASAQGLVDYHCDDPSNPFGEAASVEALAEVAPESVPVGGTVELSDIKVGVHFANSALFSDTDATLTATLAPGGAVAYGQTKVDGSGILITEGGSAHVPADGAAGETLHVALTSFHIAGHYPISGGTYTLTCHPVGDPSILASMLLTDPNTPPGPDVIVRPATPILSQIRYAG